MKKETEKILLNNDEKENNKSKKLTEVVEVKNKDRVILKEDN